MNPTRELRPFPIPVVGAFSAPAPVADETLDYVAMPQGMAMYRPPVLPEAEQLAGCDAVVAVFNDVLTALNQITHGSQQGHAPTLRISLSALSAPDLVLVNQILGEGEVSAQVLTQDGAPAIQIQESVFAGVWRVLCSDADGAPAHDWIEVGAVPQVLQQSANEDADSGYHPVPDIPAELINVPSLLVELQDQRNQWAAGQAAHVVNLTLLPLSTDDIAYLDHGLGTGRVLILSRGYGNCRITNCRVPHTWRVVYYNSQDTVILNTVEVTDMPEVACAAPEDLHDSAQRLQEVIAWIEHPQTELQSAP